MISSSEVLCVDGPEERRQHPRRLAGGTGFARPLNGAEQGEPRAVDLVDVSEAGLSMRCAVQMERGATLLVRFNDLMVIGRVRHCTRRPDGFAIGLQIDEMLRRKDGGYPTAL